MTISKSFSFWANDLITETLTEETISQLFGLHILKVTVMKSKKGYVMQFYLLLHQVNFID